MLKYRSQPPSDGGQLRSALKASLGRAQSMLLKTFDLWTHEDASFAAAIDKEARRANPDYYSICTWLRMMQDCVQPQDRDTYQAIVCELEMIGAKKR